jgi:transmembrane sensor
MTVTAVAERDSDLFREASEWFARFDGNDVPAEERRRFQTWRRRSPDHERAFQAIRSMWSAPELDAALSRIEPAACTLPSAVRSSPRHSRVWMPAVAAAAVLILTTLWSLTAGLLTILQSDYRTAAGEQRTVHLPDQSSITLNTDTAIAMDLGGPTRRVHLLKGEALFRVSRDPDRPFTVEHKGNVVRVLGTEFVVRERQQAITVTVVRGSVEVSGSDVPVSVKQLAAGQQVSAGPEGLGTPRSVDPADLTAWTDRRLAVTNLPLSDVIQEIQRYHPGFVWIWNPAIGRIRVTGIYDLSNTTETLKVLADTLPIRMSRLTDRLIVLR